jgi:hypothetical protein
MRDSSASNRATRIPRGGILVILPKNDLIGSVRKASRLGGIHRPVRQRPVFPAPEVRPARYSRWPGHRVFSSNGNPVANSNSAAPAYSSSGSAIASAVD